MKPIRHDSPPTAVTMTQHTDEGDRYRHLVETLPGVNGERYRALVEGSGFEPDDLLVLEGIGVKACNQPRGWAFVGRLHTLREDGAIVVSTIDETFWTGSPSDFFQMWTVD